MISHHDIWIYEWKCENHETFRGEAAINFRFYLFSFLRKIFSLVKKCARDFWITFLRAVKAVSDFERIASLGWMVHCDKTSHRKTSWLYIKKNFYRSVFSWEKRVMTLFSWNFFSSFFSHFGRVRIAWKLFLKKTRNFVSSIDIYKSLARLNIIWLKLFNHPGGQMNTANKISSFTIKLPITSFSFVLIVVVVPPDDAPPYQLSGEDENRSKRISLMNSIFTLRPLLIAHKSFTKLSVKWNQAKINFR